MKEKVTITNEKGETVKTSLKDLEEELKASDVGKRILSGGRLTVPVVDYIKDKYKLKSVETTERLEKELIFMYQDLVDKGFTKEQIEGALQQADPRDAQKKFSKKHTNTHHPS